MFPLCFIGFFLRRQRPRRSRHTSPCASWDPAKKHRLSKPSLTQQPFSQKYQELPRSLLRSLCWKDKRQLRLLKTCPAGSWHFRGYCHPRVTLPRSHQTPHQVGNAVGKKTPPTSLSALPDYLQSQTHTEPSHLPLLAADQRPVREWAAGKPVSTGRGIPPRTITQCWQCPSTRWQGACPSVPHAALTGDSSRWAGDRKQSEHSSFWGMAALGASSWRLSEIQVS